MCHHSSSIAPHSSSRPTSTTQAFLRLSFLAAFLLLALLLCMSIQLSLTATLACQLGVHRLIPLSSSPWQMLVAGGKCSNMGGTVDDEEVQDISPSFLTALHDAFMKYQTSSSNSNSVIPTPSLLPALQFFVQKVMEEVVPNAAKVCLRPIKQEDLDMLAQNDPLFNIEQPIDIDKFQQIAMRILKKVAIDRVKRLGWFIISGVLVIHLMKNAAKRIPYVGPYINAFTRTLMPTPVLGPLVGIAGAVYLQEFSDRAFMRFVNLINQ